jgi:MFS transporter, DHA1 family, multidrug resistance protein
MRPAAFDPAREGRFVLLLGALVAFGPLAIDLYLPALPAMAAGLAAASEAVQLTITVFLAGFSLGMLFYGPLSDRYGRRKVMLGGIALFVVASLACMLATAIEYLIVARFFQALGGGAASVLARAVVRDVYKPDEAIRKLSLMAMVTAIAPLLAPLLGSVLLAGFGWRGTFAALLVWGLLSLLVVWRVLPETLPVERRGQLSLGRAFAAYGGLLLDPVALGLVLAGGMSFAAMFAYITASPFYFIELHAFSPLAYGLLFAANALGIFAANYLNSRLVRSKGPVVMAGIGCGLGFVGAVAALGGEWGGWRLASRHHWLVHRGQHDRLAGGELRRPADGALPAECRCGGGRVWRRPVWPGHAGQCGGQLSSRRQWPADGLGHPAGQRAVDAGLSDISSLPTLKSTLLHD